jgi:hypothetical protein
MIQIITDEIITDDVCLLFYQLLIYDSDGSQISHGLAILVSGLPKWLSGRRRVDRRPRRLYRLYHATLALAELRK